MPAFAQEQSTPVPDKTSDVEVKATPSAPLVSTPENPVSAERLALAQKMHEIWPIRTRVEAALSSVAENMSPEQQAKVKAAMRKNIKYDQLEEESIKAMATTFNEEELKAMIAFYGSDVGRSISAKTGDYERSLTPIMIKMMDKAMLDLRTGSGQ